MALPWSPRVFRGLPGTNIDSTRYTGHLRLIYPECSLFLYRGIPVIICFSDSDYFGAKRFHHFDIIDVGVGINDANKG